MKKLFLYVLLLVTLVSCLENVENAVKETLELKQVKLLSYASIDVDKIRLEFNDEVTIEELEVIGHPIKYYEVVDNVVTIFLKKQIYLQSNTFICGKVENSTFNSYTFRVPIAGYNDEIAKVLISEIRVKSSSNRPDSIELYVTKGGNLSGVSLFLGIPSDYKEKYTFGDYRVTVGEILVIQVGKGIKEFDKTYPMPNLPGLSSTMGVITVVDQDGVLQDAIFYSNRNSETQDGYNGLYSDSFKAKVNYIYKKGGWISNKIESAIDPSGSTATRTLVRKDNIDDTNSKNDWYITKTSGCTFGYINIY